MSIILNGTTGVTYPNGSLSFPALTYAVGTTSLAPLTLQAGTNLTSAAAGNVEYDGKVKYFTPIGTQRGITPAAQYYRLDSALVGSATTSAQSLFGVGCTLSANTVYAMEMMWTMTKSANSSTHTVSMGFGGTATVNNILYFVSNLNNNAPMPVSADTSNSMSTVATTAATVITENYSSLNQVQAMTFNGTVSINAGGTFIPQYTTSASTGPYSILAGSYIYIYPIGSSGANINVGTWA